MTLSTRKAIFYYPLATLFNSYSMTGLLIAFGLFGYSQVAADIGIVQGATLALFYAFSANARNLILADDSDATASRLLQARLVLMLPLAAGAWMLSVNLVGVSESLATVLIIRRMAEWVAEIGNARNERKKQLGSIQRVIAIEIISFMACILCSMVFDIEFSISAIAWALAPLVAIRGMGFGLQKDLVSLRKLMPHFGSTTIVGVSVYVFRISIALLMGKVPAGELFTAFAIGGAIPTVFGQAFAPTLIHRSKLANSRSGVLTIVLLMSVVGAGLTALIVVRPDSLLMFGRSDNFWLSIGLSIVGGALMLIASTLRARLIYSSGGTSVFGPDLLSNVLIVIAVPCLFSYFGATSLVALYLIGACLNLSFIWIVGRNRGGVPYSWRNVTLFTIGALLVLPLFFQMYGGLFTDPAMVFESKRDVANLPIPLSVVVLFVGIAVLANYQAASRALLILYMLTMIFVATSLFTTQGNYGALKEKLLLLAQYLLPVFGLILGEMYGAVTKRPIFECAALSVLAIVLPLQLLSTWAQGYSMLHPQVIFFSIYQHLQYFPTIVAALMLMILFGLWGQSTKARLVLSVFVPVVLIYLFASRSLSAMVASVIGMLCFAYWHWHGHKLRWPSIILVALTILCASGYLLLSESGRLALFLQRGDRSIPDELSLQIKLAPAVANSTPVPLPIGATSRLEAWQVYASGICDTTMTLLLGHVDKPRRELYSSAHNYWLDLIYSFGLIGVMPLLALIWETARMLFRSRKQVLSDPVLMGSALATVYLVLGDSLLKVGMRQPYSGALTFFLWGLLIARLSMLVKQKPRESSGV